MSKDELVYASAMASQEKISEIGETGSLSEYKYISIRGTKTTVV